MRCFECLLYYILFICHICEAQELNFRLPKNLKPTLYDITLKPYIGRNDAWSETKDFTFEGAVNMSFICNEPTNKIVFHSIELEIDTNSLVIESSVDTTITISQTLEFDYRRNFVIVTMNRLCLEGQLYSLKLKYMGVLLTSLYGFYRSSYLDTNGKQVFLASTHFSPTDARRAFPCMDEPAMKAKFKLTLIRHKHFPSTFFNAPRLSTTVESDEWMIDNFDTTLPMSSYLVGFVVADFKNISKTTPKGILIELAARPASIDNGDGSFALEEASQIIDFFADYFNVSYPTPKSSQVAIPDFNAGAMENWGLILYREESLLYNPNRDQITNKRRVSLVVSHELAHQWFGNLVTPLWWNDLWLKEGFASWVEYLGYNKTHPEWRDLEFFFVQKLSPFVQDSLESSHPISVNVNDPAEINSLFDSISYSKGSSVIRMMSAFLTEHTFKNGVSNYLNKYALSNANQDNLWDSMSEQAHLEGTLDISLSVKTIMDSWILQKGYPLLTINRLNNQLHLKQRWFLLNPLNTVQNTAEFNKYKWYIAFTYTTKEKLDWNIESTPNWFAPDLNELTIELPIGTRDESWYIGNIQHSGWYRVNYDITNWNLLINQLTNDDHSIIHPIHRAQLLDDSFNLGRAEVIDQLVFFNISKYLTKEMDGLAFTAAFAGFNFMSSFIEDETETYELFKEYYKRILNNTYYRFGWDLSLDDANDINLQTSTLSVMCNLGNPECINISRVYYKDWLENNIALPVNFKNIIYQTVISYGDENEWKRLYEISLLTLDNSEKLRMLRGLAASRDYSLLKFLLYKTSNASVVREQDRLSLIGTISANSVSRRLAYDYMEENWDEFIQVYGSALFALPNLVTSCTSRLNKEFDLARVQDFIRRTPNLGSASEAFTNAIEKIRTNIRWTQRNMKSIYQWLQQNN